MGGYRSARQGRWRRAFKLTALTIIVLAVLAGGALAAAIHWWSGATLAADPVALARVKLQPLAGSLVSARAYTKGGVEFPVSVSHGRLVPGTPVPTGLGIRVRIVVQRSGLLAHLLGRRHVEELSVDAPASAPASRYVTVARGAPVRIRFTTPVDRVTVDGHTMTLSGTRTVSLGTRTGAAGTIVLASAARPWEQFGRPVRVTWFRASSAPAVLVSPGPSATVSPGTSLRLVFAEPVADVLGSARPRITPDVAGRWSAPDTHTLVFHPAGFGFPFGKTVRVRLGRTTTAGRTLSWTVPDASVLRLHQLLAEQGYLPVDWTAADPSADTRATELRDAVDPPAGTFSWRYPSTPPQLTSQWSPTKITQITRGAVMMFEDEHHLTVDGFAGPQVWRALLADQLAGKRRTGGYSYVYVHTQLPQLLTLWRNGQVVLTSPGNTGIPATPTTPGTFPVFEHIPVGEMQGTNPDGSHYDDTGIRWISYFHGGEALHAFNRASFGTPQSLGCVELPLDAAAKVWPYTPIGTLVTIEN